MNAMSSSTSKASSTSSSSLLSSSTTTTTTTTAQVLTQNVINSLVSYLDASDVVECYKLTRSAILHGIANNTVTITKTALGLRYHPSSNTARPRKRPLELTLEYGPGRAGPDLQHEILPVVQYEAAADPSAGGTTTTSTSSTIPSQVSWQNEAKVYFNQQIHDNYQSATYLASLSGAVLPNLLEAAVDYPMSVVTKNNKRRKRPYIRYQPFVIVSNNNNNIDDTGELHNNNNNADTILWSSSNDLDFMIAMYQQLAEWGVELKPVLPVQAWQVRLTATSLEKIQAGVDIDPSVPAMFFQKLQSCIESIATATVLPMKKNTVSTTTPTTTTTATTTSMPSVTPTMQTTTAMPSLAVPTPVPTTPQIASTTSPTMTPFSASNNNGNNNNRHLQHEELEQQQQQSEQQQLEAEEAQHIASDAPQLDSELSSTTSSPALTFSSLPTTSPIVVSVPTPLSDSEQAAQAAADAQKAAETAKESGNEQAAEAAEAAATAAQKAADVTANQAAAMAQEALLSGDATAMAMAASACLRDPVYNIRQQDSTNNNITTIYLYWDGSFYYRANLTAPYIQVVPITIQMPQPPTSGSAGGSFFSSTTSSTANFADRLVDWSIALIFLSLFLAGALLVMQQIMGKNLIRLRRLYQFQRWFFDPLHYEYDYHVNDGHPDNAFGGDSDNQALTTIIMGEESAIPFSMGGRPKKTEWNYHHLHAIHTDTDGALRGKRGNNGRRNSSSGSDHGTESFRRNGSKSLQEQDDQEYAQGAANSDDYLHSRNQEYQMAGSASNFCASNATTPDQKKTWLRSGGGDLEMMIRRRSPSSGGSTHQGHFFDSSHNSSSRSFGHDDTNDHDNDYHDNNYLDDDGDDDQQEMIEFRHHRHHTSRHHYSAPPPERLLRDPDLVDLPDLKSKSKVAVPVSINQSIHSVEEYYE